ncbi:MAG: Aspartyl/glutamyl-tRNA(Asn/Gln) amidotransferase subunit B [Parcubacteria group bacterium GW2011_GWF2_43_11]|nr:MAG: Aspartyl/glutamyl-tRNA(Asn/Gln) amidotransferase subunit B [Parcubacteria group bacterium GW2011_GWF2_43_11]
MAYTPTIGLEIHVELRTKSKMFCSCANNPDEKQPNVNICPICMGHPGTLPVINEEALKMVIKTGLALNSSIPEHSKFDRKNYFYPDLPKGYQISQYDEPLCKGGFLTVNGRKIDITRVHLEEDTGRLIHPKGTEYSLVDFNRAGIPLMELVTEPDINSAEEAKAFAEELRLILRYLGVSDADMEKGEMRVEANISLGDGKKLGTKVEIKNLNSFRSVEYGINYEIERQEKVLKADKKVIQETRGWDAAKEVTVTQRIKEAAHDYRYFPEPDLPPLQFTPEEVKKIKAKIPELPQSRRERLKREYVLGEQEIEIFVQNKGLGEYFEKVVSEFSPRLLREEILKLIKLAANYLISDLQSLLSGRSVTDKDFKITPENFAEFIDLIAQGTISSKIAKAVLQEIFITGGDPSNIIKEKGLTQITGAKEIEAAVQTVIAQNHQAVADFKKGKGNALQFLIGKVMLETRGKASPEVTGDLLKKLLS